MDFRDYARKFCEMQFVQARRKAEQGRPISGRGEEGVLLVLYTAKRKLQAKEISGAVDLTPGRVTNILNALEKRGYVAKEQSEQDRRVVYITLTDQGKRHIEDRYEMAVNYLARLFETLGEEDTEAYFRITVRIHEIAEKMGRTGKDNDALR